MGVDILVWAAWLILQLQSAQAAIEGFSLANLTADYAVTKQIAVSGRVTNLFGSEHSTFGLLGDPADVLGPGYDDPRFLSPGAPRAAWVGVVFSLR
jgi:hypothetical protein